jgi:hypothetical protein
LEPAIGKLHKFQVRSPRRPQNNSFSHHRQIAHRKQFCQLGRVFEQARYRVLLKPNRQLITPKQVHDMRGLFHSRIRQVKPVRNKMNANHCGNWKRRTSSFACRRKVLD